MSLVPPWHQPGIIEANKQDFSKYVWFCVLEVCLVLCSGGKGWGVVGEGAGGGFPDP